MDLIFSLTGLFSAFWWSLGGGILKSSKIKYFSDSHNNKSEPFSLTNITIGISFRQFDVKFWVRNIFDKRYAVRGFYFGLIPPEYNKELRLSYGDPRQLGLTIDCNF